jgi:methylmalonyl-CoA mutase N-terminal domain/subunit
MLYTINRIVAGVKRRSENHGLKAERQPALTPGAARRGRAPEEEPVIEVSADGRLLATASGLPLKDFYDRTDAPETLEAPGAYPFTRGITPRMYREELWQKDLYAGFGSAEDARQRYEFLLAQGASGVNIALDLPTQLGLDSDHPSARGEVG